MNAQSLRWSCSLNGSSGTGHLKYLSVETRTDVWERWAIIRLVNNKWRVKSLLKPTQAVRTTLGYASCMATEVM